jgi:hypothetical protein
MPQINTQELLDYLRTAIVQSVRNDRDGVISIFKRNGVDLPASLNENELYIAVVSGMKVSPSFKNDVTAYLKSSPYAQYVEDNFEAADGTSPATTTTGSTLKQSLTPERVGSYLDAAANLLVSALGSKMRREGEERAINYELAQKERLAAESQAKAPFAEGQKKILIPVLIGVSALFIGGMVYYFIRQGNKGK